LKASLFSRWPCFRALEEVPASGMLYLSLLSLCVLYPTILHYQRMVCPLSQSQTSLSLSYTAHSGPVSGSFHHCLSRTFNVFFSAYSALSPEQFQSSLAPSIFLH
jgi:hypothetical protein